LLRASIWSISSTARARRKRSATKVLTDFRALTGLSKSYIDGLDLRVPLGPFSTELLRDRHLMTSRLDSRFAGYQLDAGATNTSFDYSNANIEDCFLTAFEAYIRNDLNYKNDGLYYVAGNAPPWSGEYNTVVNMETVSPRIRTCICSWEWDITISPVPSTPWSGPSRT
jgi:carboxypeptidase C (cathepsin A)